MTISSNSTFPQFNLPKSGILNSSLVSDHLKVLDFHYMDSLVPLSKNLPIDDFSGHLTHIHKIAEAKVFQQDESEFIVDQLKEAEKLFSEIATDQEQNKFTKGYSPPEAQMILWADRLNEINENITNVVDTYDHYKPSGLIVDTLPDAGDIRRQTKEVLIHGRLYTNSEKTFVLSNSFPTAPKSSPAAATTADMYKERLFKYKFQNMHLSAKNIDNIFNDTNLNTMNRKYQVTLDGHKYLMPEQIHHDIHRLKYLKINSVLVSGLPEYTDARTLITGKTNEQLYTSALKSLNEKDPQVKNGLMRLLGQGFGGYLTRLQKEFDSDSFDTKFNVRQLGGYSVEINEKGDKIEAKIEFDYKFEQDNVAMATSKAVMSIELFRGDLISSKFTKSSGKVTFDPIKKIQDINPPT